MEILITENQYNRFLLLENRESKNLSIARNVARSINPSIDAQKVIDNIRTDIPSSRLNQCSYLPGVVRMYLQGQINDTEKIFSINSTLKLLANAHSNEYDNDLNGLSAQELINRFANAVRNDFEEKKRKNSQKQFTPKSDYKVVVIPDAETANKYAGYVSWCVCHNSNMYDSYTHDGVGVFYFLLKNGFENVKKVKGENCPLDEYGLSMIAVSINEDGSINTSTCRWNHDNGGNDNILSDEELSRLLGEDVYQILKPRKIDVLADNERFRVFKKSFTNDVVLYDKKIEKYSTFGKDGFANAYRSYYDEVYGKVNLNGEFVTEPYYSCMSELGNDGYFSALKGFNNGILLVNTNGKEWYPCGIDHYSNKISDPSKNGTRFYSCPKGQGIVNFIIKKEITPDKYDKIRPQEIDGNFRVIDKDGNIGLVDDNLNEILKPGDKYDWIDACCDIDGQLIRAVGKETNAGVIDSKANIILPCIYSDVYDITPNNITLMRVKSKDNITGKTKKGILKFINNQWVLLWDDGQIEQVNK